MSCESTTNPSTTATSTTCTTATRTALEASINALLDGYHAAAAIGDFEGYFGAMHPEGRFLGR